LKGHKALGLLLDLLNDNKKKNKLADKLFSGIKAKVQETSYELEMLEHLKSLKGEILDNVLAE
jgi:hypothetical protein